MQQIYIEMIINDYFRCALGDEKLQLRSNPTTYLTQ